MTAAWGRSNGLTLAAWVVGAGATAAVAGSPRLVFGLRSPELHLVFDSVDACVALLLAFLVFGRLQRTRRLQDLLLFHALALLAVAGLGLALLIDVFGDVEPDRLGVWLPLMLRVVAALLILAASFARDRAVTHTTIRRVLVLPWLVLAVPAATLWLAGDGLPVALDPDIRLTAENPVIVGHPLLLTALGLGAACFLTGSVLFTSQAARSGDLLLRWLGPACAIGGFARIHYLLFPSIYSDWIYTGDLLRTAFYLLLLVGAGREISDYWQARATVAVLEDRRRLARELHDGLMQEVGYIRSEAATITSDDELAQRIIDACDRAQFEARAAIEALSTDTGNASLAEVLSRAAYDVLARYGGELVVELDAEVTADVSQQHTLARITREAVGNAVRHGAATSIRLRLERDTSARRLLLQDDGLGFDPPTAAKRGGFGLISMRERAEALPGSFEVRSRPGEGTRVRVEW